MCLVFHSSYVYQLTFLSHAVTVTICDSVIVMWYFPMLHPSNKEKKRKEILNNNLAILPSHDMFGICPDLFHVVNPIVGSDG